MYKLFLCLRYLLRRRIALVAIVGMALCVLMVVIVGCVMNGFLDLVENGARGMMGDVIVDSAGGMEHFEQFLDELKGLPEVVEATPVMYSVGLLQLRDSYTEMVRIAGIRLPEAARVTSFADDLYPEALAARPAFHLSEDVVQQLMQANVEVNRRLDQYTAMRDDLDARLMELQDADDAEAHAEQIERLGRQLGQVGEVISAIRRRELYAPDLPGIILGVDLPFISERDETTGEYTRFLQLGGPEKAMLTMLPKGRGGIDAMTQPVKRTFTLVGDQRFGIYMVDSSHVYVDFDELARLLDAQGRCDQIQVKLAPDAAGPMAIETARGRIAALWEAFAAKHELNVAYTTVQTWRQKQAAYIDTIAKQRDLMVIILGVISLVAVVLVFAIFYMMVVQKTRDIGIVKSIGASDGGVAQVFLMYGAAVGLVGSVLGAIGGVLFVRNINAIHDWIATAFGWRMFNRQTYLFDRIPDQVDYHLVAAVVLGAILAGVLGSLAPSLQAARMQPVESLRYE